VSKLKEQAESILAVENLTIVDNYDWLGKIGLIDFLRDIGKHFTANNLVKKDAIAERMKSEEGITYTEFSYPLLQAYDFLHLNREYNCDLQVGGSDQWGNITAGVDLIRRVESKTVYALTVPLVIDKATGKKFGKSEGNAVWLSAEKTSPYAFYQFWLNTSDESVEDFLKLFTVLSLPEIEAIMKEHSGDKGKRIAQRALARAVCEIVHGKAIAQSVEEVTAVFFGNSPNDHIAKVTFVDGFLAVAPHTKAAIGDSLVEILVTAQLAESKRQAREFIEGGAISINHADKVTDVGYTLGEHDFFANGLVLLKKGKVAHVLVKE
jgi:tyrosyl-tRNA synthetase